MRLFSRKNLACSECGVLFEPRKDRYSHLCKTHAAPLIETDRRKACVIRWAETNWERLEEQYKKENEALRAAYNNEATQEILRRMAAQQEAAMNTMPYLRADR